MTRKKSVTELFDFPYNQTCVVVVQLLRCVQLFVMPWTTACQAPLSPPSPGVCSNLCPLNQWCYLTISSSAGPFSFCLQSFPVSRSFPMSQVYISGGQSLGASATVLPMNLHGWFLLGLTGLISLQSDTNIFNVKVTTRKKKSQLVSIRAFCLERNPSLFFMVWTPATKCGPWACRGYVALGRLLEMWSLRSSGGDV